MAKRGRDEATEGGGGRGSQHGKKGRKGVGRGAGAVVPIRWGREGTAPTRLGAALWDFEGASAARAAGPARTASAEEDEATPSAELRRARLMRGLRARYAEACREVMGLEKPPDDSVDRWLLEQLAQPRLGARADPLLPKPRIASSSRVLLRELLAEVPLRCPTRMYGAPALEALQRYLANAKRWLTDLPGAPLELREAVSALGAWIAEREGEARGRRKAEECPFRAKLLELREEGGLSSRFHVEVEPLALKVIAIVDCEAERVAKELSIPTEPGDVPSSDEVTLQEPLAKEGARAAAWLRYGADEIQVSALHYRKLRMLYAAHNPSPDEAGEAATWEKTFRRRLYLMLRRYITFIGLDPSEEGSCGGNMHAAAPETVFSWLKQEFGVRCELFASPLNCYFPTFFSAFPDVDRPFGSQGSFFDLCALPEGSYEVGPPYTEEVLELTARKLLALLQSSASGALSFVLFVPDWPGAGGLNLLDGPDFAAYRRSQHGGPFVLAKGRDHHYVTGVQFFADAGDDAARRYYTVPHGTRVYVLQTDAGATRWPLTEERERALLDRLRAPPPM